MKKRNKINQNLFWRRCPCWRKLLGEESASHLTTWRLLKQPLQVHTVPVKTSGCEHVQIFVLATERLLSSRRKKSLNGHFLMFTNESFPPLDWKMPVPVQIFNPVFLSWGVGGVCSSWVLLWAVASSSVCGGSGPLQRRRLDSTAPLRPGFSAGHANANERRHRTLTGRLVYMKTQKG